MIAARSANLNLAKIGNGALSFFGAHAGRQIGPALTTLPELVV